MNIHALLHDDTLQRQIIHDAARDFSVLFSSRDTLIGEFSPDNAPCDMTKPVRPAFIVDFCNEAPIEPCTLQKPNFDPVLNGPAWGRIWIVLTLLAISPALFEAVRNNGIGSQQRWLLGSSESIIVPDFRQRYFQAMCGTFDGGVVTRNAKTPLEFVTSELFLLSILH